MVCSALGEKKRAVVGVSEDMAAKIEYKVGISGMCVVAAKWETDIKDGHVDIREETDSRTRAGIELSSEGDIEDAVLVQSQSSVTLFPELTEPVSHTRLWLRRVRGSFRRPDCSRIVSNSY